MHTQKFIEIPCYYCLIVGSANCEIEHEKPKTLKIVIDSELISDDGYPIRNGIEVGKPEPEEVTEIP